MRRLTPFLLFALFTPIALPAQDHKVTTGVIAYQQGNYEEALSALDVALQDPDNSRRRTSARLPVPLADARSAAQPASHRGRSHFRRTVARLAGSASGASGGR